MLDIIKNVRIFNDISSIEDQVFTGGFSEWKPAFDDYVQVIAEQVRTKEMLVIKWKMIFS